MWCLSGSHSRLPLPVLTKIMLVPHMRVSAFASRRKACLHSAAAPLPTVQTLPQTFSLCTLPAATTNPGYEMPVEHPQDDQAPWPAPEEELNPFVSMGERKSHTWSPHTPKEPHARTTHLSHTQHHPQQLCMDVNSRCAQLPALQTRAETCSTGLNLYTAPACVKCPGNWRDEIMRRMEEDQDFDLETERYATRQHLSGHIFATSSHACCVRYCYCMKGARDAAAQLSIKLPACLNDQ
jgi:hypothetical protein